MKTDTQNRPHIGPADHHDPQHDLQQARGAAALAPPAEGAIGMPGDYEDDPLAAARQTRRDRLWAALLIGGLTVLYGFTLLRFPAPHVDDAWNVSRAWGFLNTGQVYGSLDAGVFEHYPGYWTYFPWVATYIHAPFVALMGPTLLSVRVASLLFSVLLLGAVYTITRRLGSHKAAMLAVMVTGTSGAFVFSSHLGRHDIIVAALGVLAIALYLAEWKTIRTAVAASLASGLLVGFSIDIHFNSLIYIPVLGCLALLVDGWRTPLKPRVWALGAGLLAGVAFFVAVHLSQYKDTYTTLFNIGNGVSRTPPGMTLNVDWWVSSLLETMWYLTPGLLALLGAAVVGMVRQVDHRTRYVVVLFASSIVAFSAVISIKQSHYMVLVVPLAAVFVGVGLERLVTVPPVGGRTALARMRVIGWATVMALLLAWPLQGLMALLPDSYGDFDRVVADIQRVVPDSAVIMGSQIYWFGFTNARYLSWEQLMYYQRAYAHTSTADALKGLGVQYFIMDQSVARYSIPEPGNATPDLASPSSFQGAIRAFLGKNGHLLATIQSSGLGQIQVYKLDQQSLGSPIHGRLPAFLAGAILEQVTP